MLSSNSSSSSHQTTAEQPYFTFSFENNNADLTRDILLFASNPQEDLCVNHAFSDAMNHPAYWRQLLQRDFGLPWYYCSSLVNNNQDPVATLRAVYQRLTHLKAQHPSTYQRYKDLLLDRGIQFLPLSAIGPFYPAIEDSKRAFYLCEAIRLKNTGLAAHILLQKIPQRKNNEPLDWTWVNRITLEIAINMATKATKKTSKKEAFAANNKELLKRILPYFGEISCSNIPEVKVGHLILSDARISPSDYAATTILNDTIAEYRFDLAIKLLKKGAAPNDKTLGLTSSYMPLRYDDENHNLYSELLNLVPTYPQLLNVPDCRDSFLPTRFFDDLFYRLLQIADVKLTEAIYESAKGFPRVYDKKRLAGLFMCILKIAVMRGDLDTILAHQNDFKKETAVQIMCFAIEQGQLAILQHYIKQIDKNTLICTNEIMQAIKACPHKSIIKYFVEEFELFKLDDAAKKLNDEPSQGVAGYLFGLWGQARNALKQKMLEPVRKNLLDLKQSWQNCAASKGNVDILDYFFKEAPKQYQLTPNALALVIAINLRQEATVRYLIENCHIKPRKEYIINIHGGIPNLPAELFVYLASHCLDFTSTEVTPQALMWYLGRMKKPNDAANKVLDWLMGPEAKKRGYHRDDLISNLHTRMSAPISAWLKAKLKIDSEDFLLTHMERFSNDNYNTTQFYPSAADNSCEKNWDSIYRDAFNFYYDKYYREMHSVETSSSAVILNAIKKENGVEQKSQASSQAQHRLPLAAAAAISFVPEIELQASHENSVGFRL